MARHTKSMSILSLILGFAAISSGLVYIFIPVYNILWNWLGAFFLSSIFITIILVYSNNRHLQKSELQGRKLNNLGLNFLGFSILAMIGMALINTIIYSRTYAIGWEIFGRTVIYFLYFGLLLFGGLVSIKSLILCENSSIWEEIRGGGYETFRDAVYSKILNSKITGRNLLLRIICYGTLGFGLFASYIILVGTAGLEFGGDISQFGFFLSIINFFVSDCKQYNCI